LRRVPIFRSKGHSLPSSSRLVPLMIAVVVCLVLIGLAALALLEPRPPVKHFEVPVPSERFAR
jgi:hypothetical protein